MGSSFLTNTLYYTPFLYTKAIIPKKDGSDRELLCPIDSLKEIQVKLLVLLEKCISENPELQFNQFAHGFVKDRSILTNAECHLNSKLVLNMDIKDYFDSFNFGRVRSFFIKNKNFKLNEDIATVISQIAVHDNKLPQGSPCSPMIANLITHGLDIRCVSLARRNSCFYTRYADDITISTRKKEFPSSIALFDNDDVKIGDSLSSIINKSGFEVNEKKSRIQFSDSRQDVTGLVVNKKISVKKEYSKKVRAMCHNLFSRGEFFDEGESGSISKLEGKLGFIDNIDHYNNKKYCFDKTFRHNGCDLNKREMLKHQFLFYKYFHANTKPIIICEGKTDNVYLKSAIKSLAKYYPLLANCDKKKEFSDFEISFFTYSRKSKFFLDLNGGTGDLQKFIQYYSKEYDNYNKILTKKPVIIVLDNDDGIKGICSYLKNEKKHFNSSANFDELRNVPFINLTHNLYVIIIPKASNVNALEVEDYFEQEVLSKKIGGAVFNRKIKIDSANEYGKNTFATQIVQPNYLLIDFKKFKPLLDNVSKVIQEYVGQKVSIR